MGANFTLVELLNIVLITGVIYGLIFCSVLFFLKKRFDKLILLLNLQVLFITLNNLQAWLIDMQIVSSNVYIKYLKIPWYFLSMPLFYLFLIKYLKVERKVSYFFRGALFTFLSFIILRLSLVYYAQISQYSLNKTHSLMMSFGTLEEVLSFIFTLFTLILSFSLFYKKRKEVKYVLNFDDLKWLKQFLFLGSAIITIWVVAIIMNINDGGNNSPSIYYPLRLSTTILIYWIGFKGLFRIKILEDRIVLRELIKNQKLPKIERLEVDTEQNTLNKPLAQFNKINQLLIDEKLFLNPNLSLESLADRCEISSGYLSNIVNTFSSLNFSDYINKFRVEQAKVLIKDKDYTNYTIVAIGLESGFNSKSTFYSAFKKFTAQNPSDYKNTH